MSARLNLEIDDTLRTLRKTDILAILKVLIGLKDGYGEVDDVPLSGSFVWTGAGSDFSCALDDAGSVDCWGRNDYGQTNAPSGSFLSLSAGATHFCAINTSNNVSENHFN